MTVSTTVSGGSHVHNDSGDTTPDEEDDGGSGDDDDDDDDDDDNDYDCDDATIMTMEMMMIRMEMQNINGRNGSKKKHGRHQISFKVCRWWLLLFLPFWIWNQPMYSCAMHIISINTW